MKIGVAAIAKNEALYIKEWIAHYLSLGFDEIIIGDNVSDDGTSEILERLGRAGVIRNIRFPTGSVPPQIPFYDQVIQQVRGRLDVLCIFDIDEFLFSVGGKTDVREVISKLFADESVSAAVVNWCVFGSSGQVELTEGLLVERFKRHGTLGFGANRHYKAMIRPERIYGMHNPHHPAPLTGRVIDSMGRGLKCLPLRDGGAHFGVSEQATWDALILNHYFCKSLHEFKSIKLPKGLADSHRQRKIEQFHAHDVNQLELFDLGGHADVLRSYIRKLEGFLE
ncbi:MAG: glycosyltransferase family 2 protein [Pseudomonadota bacterium]